MLQEQTCRRCARRVCKEVDRRVWCCERRFATRRRWIEAWAKAATHVAYVRRRNRLAPLTRAEPTYARCPHFPAAT
ncbi:hypothetical protein FOA52_009472 [Chlamydomonas sp. UWO 241]|nr:hypothetical protein FOA52_009472 [Chlamydomonas sp. UWO 241]